MLNPTCSVLHNQSSKILYKLWYKINSNFENLQKDNLLLEKTCRNF